jgi:sulfatase maturation enzyme AslB (radical SAM superfamily)
MKTEKHKSVIEITTIVGCKVSCIYCPQKKFITAYRKRSDILKFDFENYQYLLSKIPDDVDIYFCGFSEPFLHPECAKMISYTHQKGHKVSIDTTLVGMTLDDVKILKDIPLDFLAIHLPSNNGYENIPVNDNYLELLHTVTNKGLNYAELYLHFYGESLHEKIHLKNTRRLPLYTRGGSILVETLGNPPRQKGKIGCRRNLRYNILLPNGDVVLCSTDWELKHILGNLNSMAYNSLYTNVNFRNIVDGLNDDSADILCRSCELHTFDKDLYTKFANSKSRIIRKLREKYIIYVKS